MVPYLASFELFVVEFPTNDFICYRLAFVHVDELISGVPCAASNLPFGRFVFQLNSKL